MSFLVPLWFLGLRTLSYSLCFPTGSPSLPKATGWSTAMVLGKHFAWDILRSSSKSRPSIRRSDPPILTAQQNKPSESYLSEAFLMLRTRSTGKKRMWFFSAANQILLWRANGYFCSLKMLSTKGYEHQAGSRCWSKGRCCASFCVPNLPSSFRMKNYREIAMSAIAKDNEHASGWPTCVLQVQLSVFCEKMSEKQRGHRNPFDEFTLCDIPSNWKDCLELAQQVCFCRVNLTSWQKDLKTSNFVSNLYLFSVGRIGTVFFQEIRKTPSFASTCELLKSESPMWRATSLCCKSHST